MSFRFQSRVTLYGTVTIKTGARLVFNGMSKSPQPDLSIVKDASSLPYIPGSTFRRLLRSHAQEQLLAGGYNVECDPVDNMRSCIRLGQTRTDGGVYLKNLLEECIWSDEQLKDAIENHTCMSCSVFGSQLVESKLTIDDLRPESWGPIRNKAEQERDLLEQITEDRRFVFRAILEDCDLWQRGLVLSSALRTQSKLLTVGSGGGRARAIATFELNEVRALESPREYLEALNSRSGQEGHVVDSSSWDAWTSSFTARLRESFPSHVAG